MLEWLLVVATLVLILAGISVHELGHAFACRRAGVPVKEICLLGWPLPGVNGLVLPIRSRLFPEVRWVVHPLPLGAYMVPDEARMKEVPRRSRIDILPMGPIASCVYGFVLAALSYLAGYFGDVPPPDFNDPPSLRPWAAMHLVFAAACLIFALMFCALRHVRFLHGVLLLIGVLFLPVILWVFHEMVREAFAGEKPWHEIFPGPFAVTFMARDFISASLEPVKITFLSSISPVLWIAGGLSIFIGLLNMAPLIAGDGTMIVMEFLPATLSKWLWRMTIAIVLAMIALSLVGDVLWLWSRFRG